MERRKTLFRNLRIRSRTALNEILEQFIAEELRKSTKTFPDEFYKQMFRLRSWEFKPSSVQNVLA